MRLIDAKQTKREITKYLEECIDNNKIEIDVTELQIRIFGIINNQPTAYDPEAVVAELERNANEKFELYTLSSGMNFRASGMSDAFKEAIDIVRKGGV